MADAYGSGPYGRKSLRVQLPFRPFFIYFWFLHMRMKDYYRPPASSLGKKKRVVRKRKSFFFFKPALTVILFSVLAFAVYFVCSTGYKLITSSQISNWQVKTVKVKGITGAIGKEILTSANSFQGNSFSLKDAAEFRNLIVQKYPMLREVEVSRGLLSGELTVSAKRRTPVAKFVLPNKTVKYIDSDSTVYADPNPDVLSSIPFVELEGDVPEKISSEFVDLVERTLKLEKDLSFAFLRMDLKKNTVKMYMPDGCVIDFGTANYLKKKADRAAQIIALERNNDVHPYELNFKFFENGKVFLTQLPH